MGVRSNRWAKIAGQAGRWLASRPAWQIQSGCMVSVFGTGAADYFLGREISLSAAYLLPITMASWFVGPRFAYFTAIMSTAVWSAGSLASGDQGPGVFVPIWNFLIRLFFYAFLIAILVRLQRLQAGLEARAEDRAVALANEVMERERLQHDMLAISEREQRRIGRDLHDGLCQHLTGTALAGQALAEKLAARDPADGDRAHRIVNLIEVAIGMARGMAKGLHPVDVQSDGLMQALEEFAYGTSDIFEVRCQFECPVPVHIRAPAAANHLYRIAQEGVGNAIKHGRATDIVILLEEGEQGIHLAIVDNGSGMPGSRSDAGGMGLRIMTDRAKMIGGMFSIFNGKRRGCEIHCTVPRDSQALADV